MDDTLIVATSDGVVIAARQGDGWRVARRGLVGHAATSVIAREGVILVGTQDGIFRSDDGGETWREASAGLTLRHVRWLAFHPETSDCEFAGTEPAGLFVSRDGGESWRGCPEVEQLRDEHGWFLPYSPEAGCVRGFAFHGARGYAAVEVGGLLRSDDGGATWALAAGSTGEPTFEATAGGLLPADVHSVAVHPTSPDLVFAATHAGLYRSDDGGATWQRIHPDCYCRALWLDPADAHHIVLGPATRQGWNGSIVETRDGGATWQPTAGLAMPWQGRPIERFTQVDDWLLALRDDGQGFAAPLATLRWQRILADVPDVAAVTTMGG